MSPLCSPSLVLVNGTARQQWSRIRCRKLHFGISVVCAPHVFVVRTRVYNVGFFLFCSFGRGRGLLLLVFCFCTAIWWSLQMFRYSQIIQIQMTLWETPNKKKLLLCFWFWLLFLCLHWCGRFVWVMTYHWVEYASRYSHPIQCWYKMIPNCGDITVCTQHQYSENNGPIIFLLAVITFLNVYVHFMATRWQCLIILCQQWHKKQGFVFPHSQLT